jgi:hypothetical protein
VPEPLRLVGAAPVERERRVAELFDAVGLSEHAAQRPHELSGGQQQRVAIARALANEPQLVVADESTGQLDSQTGRSVMELLRGLVQPSAHSGRGVAPFQEVEPLLECRAGRDHGPDDHDLRADITQCRRLTAESDRKTIGRVRGQAALGRPSGSR